MMGYKLGKTLGKKYTLLTFETTLGDKLPSPKTSFITLPLNYFFLSVISD